MNSFRFPGVALLLPAVLCLCSFLRTQENPQKPEQTIQVAVDRVNVGVIVTDHSGHFVEGLHREDFRVFDNGVEQPVRGFTAIEEPAQVLLLIEAGPAVHLLGNNHVRASDKLLNNLSPNDRVAIASYSRSPELLLDFTADKPTARFALQNLSFALGFGELNLASSLASAIDWLGASPGKKTLVVLSTGVDTSPPTKWQGIEQKLKTSDVRILAVSLSGDFRKPAKSRKLSPQEREDRAWVKQVFSQADQALHELSMATGGRVYLPRNEKEFDRAYSEIAQLVRHEYSIAFTPPANDGQVHTIQVKVKRLWCRVDHRQAYIAPLSESVPTSDSPAK
jgi:Ca-activated chloride channel family protein